MKLRTALLAVCTGLTVWIASALPASSATRRVVLLFDERPELPGLALLQADLVRTLTSNSTDRIEIYNEAMDLSRFGSNNYQPLLRDFLRTKYADKKIDVAIAILSPSLDFLLNYGSDIFPGTPVVFCGIDKTELGNRLLPPHVRGVLLKREFAPTVEIALSLHPKTERAVVVAGTSDFDTRLLELAKIDFGFYEDRLDFQYLTTLPLQDLLTELSHLPARTLVFYATIFRDGAGETFVPHEVVERISAAANAPTYGFLDQYIGRGIVGGNVYSISAHGVETAKLALRVLAGSKSLGPQVYEVPVNKLLFDWRQLQRWGISEAKLPAGSEIWFREPSAWEQNRTAILGITAAILTHAMLIGWLLHERQYRQRAERRARESLFELTQMNRMATAGELSAAIAHEIKQPLTGIVTMANAALRWLSRESPDIGRARDAMDKVVAAGHHASDVITNVRELFGKDTQEKAPTDINKLIRTALGLVDMDLRKHSIESQVNLNEPLPSVVGNEVQLQQVILNLVMNAIDSMNSAESAVLSIKSETTEHNGVRVSIADTGSGISLANLNRIFKPMFTTKAHGMGMGLLICKSIIESHNGRIWVSAGVPRGSIFQFELPTGGAEH
ncbi:MAG: ATP-binding protein [Xanthobacteraceae bacterium]